MAVIKSGDSVDQLHVDTHQAAYVTLRDASGAAITPIASGGAVSITNLPATQPISAVALPLPAGAATESGHLASIDTKLSGPVPVSGTVSVGNFPVSQAVTGAFFQATQPVSLAAAPLPSNAATETGGNLAGLNSKITTTANGVKVDGSAATQPVSGTLAVTQSGAWAETVTQGPAGASAWPVSLASAPLPSGAATDATLTARLPQGANGALAVTVSDGYKATYTAGTPALALVAAATDVLTLTGSATKVIRVTKIYISFTATTAISVPVSLIRRSAGNTGGTNTASAATTHDTNNPGATASVATYTANPSALGAPVGTVLESGKIPAPLTGGAVQVTVFEFGTNSNQAIVLRGTSQVLALNLNGTTVAGGSLSVAIQWVEE